MKQTEIVEMASNAAGMGPPEWELFIILFGEFVRQQAEQTEYLKSIADSLYAEGMAKYGQ